MFGLMLYGAVKTTRPQIVLELGTSQGYSTAWLLLGLMENESGHLWTCDIMPSDNPVWTILPAPYERLTYFPNDPVDSLKDKLPTNIDFIFHDAGHSWDELQKDMDWLLPKLSVGGSFVVHDVKYSSEMGEKLLEYFDTHTDEWKYERIEEGCGVGIATRIKQYEVPQCKDVSNGSMMLKAMDSSKGKIKKTTSLTTRKSKRKSKVVKRSKKTKMLSSNLSRNKKVQEPRPLSSLSK